MLALQKPVIVCVGTTSVIGDSLGPKVGDLLTQVHHVDAYVYGRTDRPVNGLNYALYFAHVKRHHAGAIVIAVDACMGEKKDVGKVKISLHGLRAGAALKKDHASFGDIGILGVVAERSQDNLSELLVADPEVVEKVAIASAKKVARILTHLRLNYPSAHTL